jgi:anti-sigma factor RsiW
MNCAEIKDRLVDYLYRELTAPERAAFEAHLSGCDACRAEVAAFEGTLARTRGAMKALDEAPPARVRVAVLEAAARAAAPAVVPLAAAAAAAPRRAPLGAREPEEQHTSEGFWAWLRRPWVVPAGLAAAAALVLLVGRGVFLDSEKLEELTRATAPVGVSGPAEQGAPAAPAPPAVSLTPPPAADEALPPRAATSERPAPPARKPRPVSRAAAPPAAAPPSGGGRFAEPPPPREAELERKSKEESYDDRLEGALGAGAKRDRLDEGTASGGPSAGVGGLSSAGRGAGAGAVANQQERRVAQPAPKPRRATSDGDMERAEPRPVTAAAPAAAPPPAPEPAPAASAPRPAAPPPPPAPKAARVREADKSVAAEEPAEVAESASAADRPAPAKAKKGSLSPLEELMQRADRQFAAGSWAAAARSYGELLRLYPEHKNVPIWKGRVRACNQALKR